MTVNNLGGKIHSNYKVDIEGEDIHVTAAMPESYYLGIMAEYAALGSGEIRPGEVIGGLVNNLFAKAAQLAASAGGVGNITQQAATWQVWRGSSSLEFNLLLLFDAEDDPASQVVKPMMDLLKLVVPQKMGGGFLRAPGTSALESLISGKKGGISLNIGNVLSIPNIIIYSVNNTFDSRLDKSGKPISGQSEVGIRTVVLPGYEDIQAYAKI